MENDNIVHSIGGAYSSKNAFLRSFEVLQSLFKDEILCDIKLKTDDGNIVNGHKVVLASASPYFRVMFTNFEECKKECVSIQELDSSALRLIVDFIYTAEIIVTEDNVQVLLFAANFLLIKDVQDACVHFLQTNLQPTNCFGIMALAELYECTELLSSSESFIQQHFSEVVLCDEFLSLTSEQIIKLISMDGLCIPSEEIVYESVIRWVKHDSDSRKDILPKLMENVRLPLTSTKFLHERVEVEPLINLSFECQRYLTAAMHFKILMHTVPKTMVNTTNTNCRVYTNVPKVILAVGRKQYITTLEWYDPITSLWQSGPEIIMSNYARFAVLKERYLFSVGVTSVKVLDLCSSSASWVSKVPIIIARLFHEVAVLDNCIYAVGGLNGMKGALCSAEVFDCYTEEWRMISSMANRRMEFGSAVLDNLLYAVGGYDGRNIFKSVECYDPSIDIWKSVADMCSSRRGAGIGVLNGVLYAVGGKDKDAVILKSVEVYRPSTRIWSLISDMNIPRLFPGVVALDGLLFVVGGDDAGGGHLNSVEFYNPYTDTWFMIAASMNISATQNGAFVVHKPNF